MQWVAHALRGPRRGCECGGGRDKSALVTGGSRWLVEIRVALELADVPRALTSGAKT